MLFTPTTALLTLTILFTTSVHAAPATAPAPAPVPLAGKYEYAATFATWDGQKCYTGTQHDNAVPDGVCNHLPGQGLTIWWLAPGCGIRIWSDENCQEWKGDIFTRNVCWGTQHFNSYKICFHMFEGQNCDGRMADVYSTKVCWNSKEMNSYQIYC